jgi:hypothetical protein
MKLNSNEIDAEGKLGELGLTLDGRITWNPDSMFPKLKGIGAKRDIRTKHKLIVQVQQELAETLYPGEEVQYVAKGVQVKFSEQYFLGIWANLINQTVFVLTSVRLLMYHSNTKGHPHDSIWMIYYSEIVKFNQRAFVGGMTMKLKDKSKYVFTGFKGADRKQMPVIFQKISQEYSALDFHPQTSQSRENLCAICKQVVPKNTWHCETCGQVYWTPSEIARRSLVFPSWGDWIMGHNALAAVELFGYVFTWVGLIALGVMPGGSLPINIAIGVFSLLAAHGIDGAVTYAIAKKGLTAKWPLASRPPAIGPTA